MNINEIKAGNSLPEDINVIIEIPALAEPIKYEIDKSSGALNVDRFVSTSMRYPCNYGFIPHTLAEDGDPIDVLVLTPYPLASGCLIRCRPIGILRMQDESGYDVKVLAVPHKKLTPLYDKINTYQDLPELITNQITHFFEHYKDLEPGKWVKMDKWDSIEVAHQEIMKGIERYK
ncbi:MAG: inorganic diphosphatase [Gammaproteobacteria bacterium]